MYGVGGITTKETRPGHVYRYVEWSVDGTYHSKSCGRADDPDSHKRALIILLTLATSRIEAILADMRGIEAELAEKA